MLRSFTGEGWDAIRNDIGNPKSLLNQCKYFSELEENEKDLPILCGNRDFSQAYFFSYGLLV